MKTNAIRFAAGLGFFAAGAPFPAFAQFIYPPVFVVPPPARELHDAKAGSQAAARQVQTRRNADPVQAGRAL